MKQNDYISKINSKIKKIKELGDTKSKLFFHATSKQKEKKSTLTRLGKVQISIRGNKKRILYTRPIGVFRRVVC